MTFLCYACGQVIHLQNATWNTWKDASGSIFCSGTAGQRHAPN